MQHFFKNLDYATPLPLAAQVDCRPGQIASKTLVQNPAVGLTLFAFDAGEEISSHTSTGDALVQVLEGSAGSDHSGHDAARARGRGHRHARRPAPRRARRGAQRHAADCCFRPPGRGIAQT